MGNGPTQVKVYFTTISTLCLNTITYDNSVYNHIRHNNVYIRPDHFKQNNTESPSIITELHPTLIQINNYETKLKQALGAQTAPDNNIAKEWLETYCPDYEDTETQVPEFKVLISAVKWGEGDNCIKMTVLKIVCADADGLYLKMLLLATFQNTNKPCGTFVPAKSWLITSPACYKKILRHHNKYITEVTTISIKGLHLKVLEQKILVSEET
eukprot:12186777-Ditylum_brightwellii.AAC.1